LRGEHTSKEFIHRESSATKLGAATAGPTDDFSRPVPSFGTRVPGATALAAPAELKMPSQSGRLDRMPPAVCDFLPRYIDGLASAGLKRLLVSLDSASLAEHERNRGLSGLGRRLTGGVARARGFGLPVRASVTVSRLVRYDELPDTLRHLGFDSVEFSYPRQEPFGSTSLVYGGESPLVDLDRDELLDTLNAAAAAILFRRSVARSLRAVVEEMPQIRRLARPRRRRPPAGQYAHPSRGHAQRPGRTA
jgi:hypothetical protein